MGVIGGVGRPGSYKMSGGGGGDRTLEPRGSGPKASSPESTRVWREGHFLAPTEQREMGNAPCVWVGPFFGPSFSGRQETCPAFPRVEKGVTAVNDFFRQEYLNS